MIFFNKREMFFWISCFLTVNIIFLIVALSIKDTSPLVWVIFISCDVFFTTLIVTLKYFINCKDLEKYSGAVEELEKNGIVISARQYEKIVMAGYGIDRNGQIVNYDRLGNPVALSPGHKIVLNHSGFPVEIDENGHEIKIPQSKGLNGIIIGSVMVTILVLGGFSVLCIFYPYVGIPLFIIFVLIILFVGLHSTRNKKSNK